MTEKSIDLKGKVALVTGSARRVGKAIALELADQGMHVVVHHSNSDAEAATTADEIRAKGVPTMIVKADLRDPDLIGQIFDAVRLEFGQLDLLVNSAANFKAMSFLDINLEEWYDVLDTNLTAPFLLSQGATRLMRKNAEGGSIVNILDLSAFRPWKTYPHHSVAKAGLLALTEVMALSLAPDIRVNAIAPGPVLRDEGNSPEKWQQIGERLPLKRTGDPSDVARAVVFLASQPFITGETIRVDGGESLT